MSEIIPTDYLNSLLSSKPTFERIRTRNVVTTEWDCSNVRSLPQPGTVEVMRGPSDGCVRKTVNRPVEERFSDHYRVTSADVIGVPSLILDHARLTMLPEQAWMHVREFDNPTPFRATSTITFSQAITSGYQITKSRSLRTTHAIGVNAEFKIELGKLGTKFDFSQTVDLTRTEMQSRSEQITKTLLLTVEVLPNSKGKVEFLVVETTLEIPYTAKVILDGPLEFTNGDLKRASDILTEQERELVLSGVIKATGGKDFFRLEGGILAIPSTPNQPSEFIDHITEPFVVPLNVLSEKAIGEFKTSYNNGI
jgi:hypothetical protein